MRLMKIDPATFLSVDLIEETGSLIWTERFREPGEFQLVTTDVVRKQLELPEGSLVSMIDSKEVMMVETHLIKTNDLGVEELTIKGRTLDFFFENRILEGEPSEQWEMQQEYPAHLAAIVLAWNAIANSKPVGTPVLDVTKGASYPPSAAGNLIDPRNYIPNLAITNAVDTSEAVYVKPPWDGDGPEPDPVNILTNPRKWYLHGGPMSPQLLDFLNIGNLGVRCIRPPSVNGMNTTVSSTGIPTFSKVGNPAGSKLRVEIYNGRNRSKTPSEGLKPVVFRQDAGHIKETSYLFSIQNLKSGVYVSATEETPLWVTDVRYDIFTDFGSTVGLVHRQLYLDIGTIPSGITDVVQYQQQLGLAELKKYNREVLLDGSVPAIGKYEYGKDYFLGDTVTLIGRHGVKQDMVVNEFVRTHDKEGTRGFPTLIMREDLVLP